MLDYLFGSEGLHLIAGLGNKYRVLPLSRQLFVFCYLQMLEFDLIVQVTRLGSNIIETFVIKFESFSCSLYLDRLLH